MPKSKANCLDPRTPKEDCTHEIRSKFTGRDILALGNGCMVSGDSNACGDPERIEKEDDGKFRLMYAAFHCHAPACISGELWNDDTGELICSNTAQCTPSKQPLPLSKSSARSHFLRPAASQTARPRGMSRWMNTRTSLGCRRACGAARQRGCAHRQC